MKLRHLSFGLSGLLLGACALGTDADPIAQNDQDIVRGHPENKLPQVVAVRINGYNGGWTLCSGTYVAQRVVITAAHCMRPDAIPGQIFVYHGKDYLTDVESLPVIPDPGERSLWARAETFVTNPIYNPGVNYPDMTVLFLDRDLPFAPIPLLRTRVSDSTKKGTIVGWGGELALVADISEVEGAGIKRSATVRLLGSPTEADYHPDDPNPGILIPEIRDALLKTDGRAPRANTCAGDSGGPLLVEHGGKNHVAGISMWTGLFCEDYSIFTRIDPFLEFFDGQVNRAGHANIVARLECVEDLGGGRLSAHFGYQNDNGITVGIPYGSRNSFDQDRGRDRPSAFSPGSSPYDFSVDFRAGQRLSWRLTPQNGPSTLVRADASSPRCAPDDQGVICEDFCDSTLDAECSDDSVSHGTCVSNCVSNADFFGYYFGCLAEWDGYAACVAGLSSDASNWDCSIPGTEATPAPPACEGEFGTLLSCMGY